MPRFVQATVSEILLQRRGLQRVSLANGAGRAYVLTDVIGPVRVDDTVVINTTAVDLSLGTGGWHVVHWNLSRDEWVAPGGGHVMKLRYTSGQLDTGVVEEADDYRAPETLAKTPVVVCVLHSQLPGVVAGIKHVRPNARIAYVMTDTAALPLALSDVVFELRTNGLLHATFTAGQAFGGEYESVNATSAMGAAVSLAAADVVVVAPGPGVVGTGTTLGFGSLDAAFVLDAVAGYDGVPFAAIRWSDADPRERHRGISHHSATVLSRTSTVVRVAVPNGYDLDSTVLHRHERVNVQLPDVQTLLQNYGLAPMSMGRSAVEDPGLHAFAAAAGVAAAATLES